MALHVPIEFLKTLSTRLAGRTVLFLSFSSLLFFVKVDFILVDEAGGNRRGYAPHHPSQNSRTFYRSFALGLDERNSPYTSSHPKRAQPVFSLSQNLQKSNDIPPYSS